MTDDLVMPEVQIIKDGLAAIFKALYEQTAADPGVMFEELTKGLAFTASLLCEGNGWHHPRQVHGRGYG